MTHNPKPWKTSTAFDGPGMDDRFTDDNWNDPFITLFRIAFAPAEHAETSIRVGLLKVSHYRRNDQNYYLIEDFHERLYVMSVYKHRGCTEAFYNAETGRPIMRVTAKNLYEQMTDPNYRA